VRSCFVLSQPALILSPYSARRSRIDLLQQEVAELNSKLIAAASRPQHDDSAAEWAPYFQALQRDNAQKIQVWFMFVSMPLH
jgi:hypothetical protein